MKIGSHVTGPKKKIGDKLVQSDDKAKLLLSVPIDFKVSKAAKGIDSTTTCVHLIKYRKLTNFLVTIFCGLNFRGD